jgi:menaquinone-dependent protoporphyrinogen oxidase
MNVLVTVASKHGATEEIGAALAGVLGDAGLAVTTSAPDEVSGLDKFDAVVLGSAVYAGRWMGSASQFADRFAADLASREVWLFSSGPIGDPPLPTEEPPATVALVERLGAREHRSFAGRLDRSRIGLMERAVTRALKVPEGDFRDWEAIRAWGNEIARDLVGPTRVVRMFRTFRAAGAAAPQGGTT